MTTDPDSGPNEWDPAAYDESHSFVFERGESVVSLLDPRKGERVLDLGCGSGHLTGRIAGAGAEVVGLDASAEMIAEARAAYPDVRFVRADARTFLVDDPFDAAFSNAMLHWVERGEQDAVLSSVYSALNPGGRFVAELGGAGNVDAVRTALASELERRGHDPADPWYFPSVGEYATLLEASGFEVRYATLFDRPTELDGGEAGLAGWLEMFGDAFLSPLAPEERRGVVGAVEDELRDGLFDAEEGSWVVDYRRLRFVAVREE